MKTRLLCWFLLTVVLSTCHKDDSSPTTSPPQPPPSVTKVLTDYFPIQTGNQWVYEIHSSYYTNFGGYYASSMTGVSTWRILSSTRHVQTIYYIFEEIIEGTEIRTRDRGNQSLIDTSTCRDTTQFILVEDPVHRLRFQNSQQDFKYHFDSMNEAMNYSQVFRYQDTTLVSDTLQFGDEHFRGIKMVKGKGLVGITFYQKSMAWISETLSLIKTELK